jgi:hypothetical protein
MADLKKDLLNDLMNKKYYAELELVRLAADPNMKYKMKIDEMQVKLTEISLLNAELGLVGQYFQDAPSVTPPAPASVQPTGHVHPGQTHGE